MIKKPSIKADSKSSAEVAEFLKELEKMKQRLEEPRPPFYVRRNGVVLFRDQWLRKDKKCC